jgi:GNAT superfamily N-acetyltransferase
MTSVLGKAQDTDYFDQCLDLQSQDKRAVLIVSVGGTDAGYAMLNWTPKYAPFKKLGIPEIQDLNVIPAFRQRGIATDFIKHCEDEARQKGYEEMGIAFGLHSSYGAAQRLYIKLGYIPDGQGATYDRKQIAYGDFKPLDDDLCLMLIKAL